jgi:flagellar biosynthesis protein FlhB
MYCEKCGVKNNETSEYCIGCGIKLSHVIKTENETSFNNEKKVPNYFIRSIMLLIFNIMFSCMIMGIVPLIFSIITLVYSVQVDKKIKEMNIILAEDFSKTTRLWVRITFLTTLILIVMFLVIVSILMFNNSYIIEEYIQEYLDYLNNRNEF